MTSTLEPTTALPPLKLGALAVNKRLAHTIDVPAGGADLSFQIARSTRRPQVSSRG